MTKEQKPELYVQVSINTETHRNSIVINIGANEFNDEIGANKDADLPVEIGDIDYIFG